MSWYHSSDFDNQEQNQDPWSSIVDLMSAFALVLFLAVTFFIINYNRASEKLKQRRVQLKQKQVLLTRSILALKEKQSSLVRTKKSEARLQALARKLAKQNSSIQKQLIILGQKEQALLAERKKLLDEKEKLSKEKQALGLLVGQKAALVKKQEEQTKKQTELLSQVKSQQQRCETKLQALLKQKKNVLSAIYKSFKASGTKGIGFDPKTGKFRLGGNVLFAEGKAILTAEGKRQLLQVKTALVRDIWKKDIIPLLSGIMVEGHTSQTGRANFNWRLSAKRSLAAVQYMLSLVPANTPRYKAYSKLLFAAAFGQYRPVMRRNVAIQRLSRRIEIKVLFKSQERIQGILRQLKSNVP